ncbi:SusC/RagA family TonB-linked outer membrane protein [Pedobacter arcticus]|uniref:SusC/RagA family TonB-linked outer membrane protein n=1 Tax=Pedobacter arcticus TaxID=752140 RepID=UPI0002F92641|nr:SusC/RagA family TonB-linked outer membrane protein [Pedobacter arcticus]
MKKLVQSLFILLLIASSVLAQDRRVTGKVTATEDGLPLPGVSVRVTGTNQGTQTDSKGDFSLNVPANAKSLEVSYIGFVKQTIQIGTRSVFNVSLANDSKQLNEVVVTALGIERQRSELGYAAATVSGETVTKASAVNVANGLQGKVSGLNVSTVSSGVFENVSINLRGIRSMTGNNNPLLVIDGIPLKIEFLSSLNPNDVQDISVLKGASSAAIYGPDARNGVILITTKKGSNKPVITVSNSVQLQQVSFFPKLQKSFGQGYDGVIDPLENWSWGPAFDGSTVDIGPELPDGSQQKVTYSGTDERQKFYDTGVTVQTDVSLSVKDFYLSLQDANVKGIVPDDENRRTSFRMNSAKEFGKFKAGANINYSQQNYSVFDDQAMSDYFSAQGTGGNDGLFDQLINTAANAPLSKYKDYKNDPFSQYNNYYCNYGLNPYFAIGNWRKNGKRQDLIANLDFSYKPTDWLNFVYRAGLTTENTANRYTSEGVVADDFGLDRGKTTVPGSIEESAYSENRLTSELFGNLTKQLDENFKLSAILGTYVRQNESRTTRVGASSLVVPGIYNVSNRIGILSGSSPGYRSRLFSVYGSAGLSYKGWANLEVTGRNDWTSLLAIGQNSYFYPGVSGSLVLSEAVEGLKSVNALSYLKLRGAWSKTGNADITPYLLASTYSQPVYTGFPYGSTPGLTAGNTFYNPNLRPEFINSTEAGFEASFFGNRVTFESTYFYQNNTDQIISINLSDATGYSRYYLNAASFINKGIEMDLNLTPLIKFKDGGIRFRANATYNDSEVTSIYKEQELNELSIGGYVDAGNYAIKGKPAFILKGTDYKRDDLGRVIVNATTGRPSADPTTKELGRTIPKWIIGLNPSVDYKNFSLSALFEHKSGHKASFYALGSDMAWTGVSEATAYNNRQPFILPNSVIRNPSVTDPASPNYYIENTTAKIGATEEMYEYYTNEFRSAASNFVVSANTWRLRELSLSYDVPQALLKNQKVLKNLTVSLVGRNLFLWLPSENKFMDPDFNSMISDYPNAFGNIDATSNPPVRTYGFNIVAKF